jgi:hypothetical protein
MSKCKNCTYCGGKCHGRKKKDSLDVVFGAKKGTYASKKRKTKAVGGYVRIRKEPSEGVSRPGDCP